MNTAANIRPIINKYNSEAVMTREANNVFYCSNFPERIEQPIIDFIECHYEVIETDYFSIRFRPKD